jgi:hypothetical protein
MKRIWKFIAAEFSLLMIFSGAVAACELCRVQVGEIYDQNFFNNLLMMLSPIIIIIVIGLGLYHGDKISDLLKGRTK